MAAFALVGGLALAPAAALGNALLSSNTVFLGNTVFPAAVVQITPGGGGGPIITGSTPSTPVGEVEAPFGELPQGERVVLDNGVIRLLIAAPGSTGVDSTPVMPLPPSDSPVGPTAGGGRIAPSLLLKASAGAPTTVPPPSAPPFQLDCGDFWRLRFAEVGTQWSETVRSSQFPVSPPQLLPPLSNGTQVAVLRWRGIVTPQHALGPANVELRIQLEPAAQTAAFQLRVYPTQLTLATGSGTPGTPWTVLEGGITLPLFQDPNFGGQYQLLSPFGDLIVDPLATIASGPSATDTYDLENFSVSQAYAFLRSDGACAYGARLDPSGRELRGVAFRARPNCQVVEATFTSYRDEVFLDGTLVDDPATPVNEDTIPVGMSAASFQSGVTTLGLLLGDWWEVAAAYRNYFAATEMAAAGPLATRTDVPAWAKQVDAVFVLNANVSSTVNLPSGPVSLVQHLLDWSDHHLGPGQQGRLLVMFFGLGWTSGTAPVVLSGIPDYGVHPSAAPLLQQLDAAGFRTGVYFYDSWAVASSIDFAAEWDPHGVVTPTGVKLYLEDGRGQSVLVSPAWTPLREHFADRARELAAPPYGVDLIYVDNFIPVAPDADHSENNSTPPGYGPSQVDGYVSTLKSMLAEGVMVYSEAPQEFFVESGFIAPFMDFGDKLGKTEAARFVPLQSVVYHEFALTGPVRMEPMVNEGFGLAGEHSGFYPSICSLDPLERTLAQRSAQHAAALGIVNGGSLWIPEPGALQTSHGWLFQAGTNYAGQPFLATLPEAVATLEFCGRLVRYRGSPAVADALRLGRRLRDLPWQLKLASTGQPASVVPVNLLISAGDEQPVSELNLREPAVQGVWRSPDGAARVVCLANFDQTALQAQVTLIGHAPFLGLQSGVTYSVQVLDEFGTPQLPTALSLPGTGILPLTIDLPANGLRTVTVSP